MPRLLKTSLFTFTATHNGIRRTLPLTPFPTKFMRSYTSPKGQKASEPSSPPPAKAPTSHPQRANQSKSSSPNATEAGTSIPIFGKPAFEIAADALTHCALAMAESDRKVWWPEEYDHAAQGGTVDIKRPDLQDGQMGLARWKASKGAQIIKKQLLATSQKRSEGDKKWVEMSLRKVNAFHNVRNFKAHFVTPQELYEAWKAHDNKKDRAVVQCLWKGVFGFDIQEYPEKDGVEKERMEKWPMAQTIRQRK